MMAHHTKHALIVIAHPEKTSLTHALAEALADGLQQDGHGTTLADLAAEGFDPRFTLDDHRAFQTGAIPPADIVREQQRVERADALILVFPVYWWSLPALLKGWLDRVLTNGWAYGEAVDGQLRKKMTGLKVHLLPLAWASAQTYTRRGYRHAMLTQIDQGIFDYVGADVVHSDLLYLDEGSDVLLERARQMGRRIFA